MSMAPDLMPRLEARYHVPRSQVWEGSRGRQVGKVHLHVLRGPVRFTAVSGRALSRGGGVSLCGRNGWYERKPERGEHHERCPRCVYFAERYRVPWPEDALVVDYDGRIIRQLPAIEAAS